MKTGISQSYEKQIPNQVGNDAACGVESDDALVGNDNAVAANGVVLVEDDFRVIPDLIGDLV